RQRILGAVVHLAGEEILSFFGAFAVRYIDGDPAYPHNPASAVKGCGCRADTPSDLAVGANDAKFGFAGLDSLVEQRHGLAPVPEIIRVQQRLHIGQADDEAFGIYSENPELPFVPHPVAVGPVPVPGTHAAGGERQAAPLLAL